MEGADDTNLLVPEYTDCQLNEESDHIQNWALKNKVTINKAKTKNWYFVGLVLLNLICMIHLME